MAQATVPFDPPGFLNPTFDAYDDVVDQAFNYPLVDLSVADTRSERMFRPHAPPNDVPTNDCVDFFFEQHFHEPSPSLIPNMQQAEADPAADVLGSAGNSNAVSASKPPSDDTSVLTEDAALSRVLLVLPDVSHDFVLQRYRRSPPTLYDGPDWIQSFIGNILEDGTYPTEREAQRTLKRKREAEAEDWKRYENVEEGDMDLDYQEAG